MKAAYLTPSSLKWEWIDIPDNSKDDNLKLLQDLVKGNIELVPNYYNNVIMYCNEEGKLLNLKPNFVIYEKPYETREIDVIVGTIVMLGPVDEDGKTTNLTEAMFLDTQKIIGYIRS